MEVNQKPALLQALEKRENDVMNLLNYVEWLSKNY